MVTTYFICLFFESGTHTLGRVNDRNCTMDYRRPGSRSGATIINFLSANGLSSSGKSFVGVGVAVSGGGQATVGCIMSPGGQIKHK